MNTHDGYSKLTLDNTLVLLAGGGHLKMGNSVGNIPLSNDILNSGLDADKLDGLHGTVSGSLLYKFTHEATIDTTTLTTDFWYATISFTERSYVSTLTKSIISASYSNIKGTVYLNTYENTGKWYAFTTNYNYSNVVGISYKLQNCPIYYVKLKKPVSYSGSVPDGKIIVYSTYDFEITVSETAPEGVTFTDLNVPGFTGLNANTATILATARNINGTPFNGSQDITTTRWGADRTITIGSSGKTVNGSQNVTWTLADIGVDGAYVKLNPGTVELTVSSKISSLSKGVLNLWRSSGDHYVFLGFSNGTTLTLIGGIGFKSQADHNLYRKDGSTYYKIADADNISNKNATIGTSSTTIATIAGVDITANIASHNHGTSKTAWGQTYVNASGTLLTISGNMTSVGNVTPSSNAGQNLGSSANAWLNVYGRNIISNSTLSLGSASATSIIFKINNVEKARFCQPNGYLGIGITSPTYPIHVVGQGYFTGDLIVNKGSSYASLGTNALVNGITVKTDAHALALGIGTGNVNRGIYDQSKAKWMIYTDNTNIISNFGAFVPGVTNSQSLGTSSLKWSKVYIGANESYGSATQPVYWNAGVPKATTYTLSASIGSGTANRMAYYSSDGITSATNIYATTTTLAVNKTSAPANDGNFLVVGTSTMRHIYPEASATYDFGKSDYRWRTLYLSTSMFMGPSGYNEANAAYNGVWITPTDIGIHKASGNAGGFFIRSGSQQQARLYLATIGTANSGDNNETRGTLGEVYLFLGNNIARPAAGTAGGANNSRGRIVIYGEDTAGTTLYHGLWSGSNLTVISGTNSTAGSTTESMVIVGNNSKKSAAAASSTGRLRLYGEEANYHDIYPGAPNGNRTHYLPNVTGWIATGGNGTSTGAGSNTQPVYLSTSGVLTATSYSLNATTNLGTVNKMAYYSGANAISSASDINTDGSYIHIDSNVNFANTSNDTSAPFSIGSLTGAHLAVNSNTIYTKNDATTEAGTLNLLKGTGTVLVLGTGGLRVLTSAYIGFDYGPGGDPHVNHTLINNTGVSVECATSSGGFYTYTDSVKYTWLYTGTIGTTSNIGGGILVLGNDICYGTDNNARGRIRLYGPRYYYTDIYAQATNNNGTVYLPDKGGNMYLIHHSDTTPLGNDTTPIYLDSLGSVARCKSYSEYGDNRWVLKTSSNWVLKEGDTMTGSLKRYYGVESDDPMISLTSNDLDVWLWRINHGTSALTDTFGGYGFGLKYIGSGSGNNNNLILYSDAQSGTQVAAMTMQQDGKITLAVSPTAPGFIKSGSSSSYVLLGDGGHKAWGNANGNLAVNNSTKCTNLNADMVDGLHIHTGRNNEVNKIVRTDASGYIQAGWINTTSGDMGTNEFNKVYVSNDSYIRYVSKSQFVSSIFGSVSPNTVFAGPTGDLDSTPSFRSLVADDIPSIPDQKVTWGSDTTTYKMSVIDAMFNNSMRANRFAGILAEGVTVEYSIDGGTTWSVYSLTDILKRNLFTNRQSSVKIGGNTNASDKSGHQLRITIDTDLAHVYTVLHKIQIYIGTNNSLNCKVTIKAAKYSTPTVFDKVICENFTIYGWYGWNEISIPDGLTTHGNQNYHYSKILFTFTNSGLASGAQTNQGLLVQSIFGYGGYGWKTPSELALNDHLYEISGDLIATFPNSVYSSKGFNARISGYNYATMYIYDSSSTQGEAYLLLGNSRTAGNNYNARGRIVLYNTNAYATTILSSATSNNTFYLPTYTGNMYAVHVGSTDAVGNANTPVYVDANGRVKTCTLSVVLDGISGFTANHYATCTNAAATVAKTATLASGIPTLSNGLRVIVNFSNKNTAANVTFSLSYDNNGTMSTTPKTVRFNGAALNADTAGILYGCVELVYAGSYWEVVGPRIVTTTNVGLVPETTANTLLYSDDNGVVTWGSPSLYSMTITGNTAEDTVFTDRNVLYRDEIDYYFGDCIEGGLDDNGIYIQHKTSGVTAGTVGITTETLGSSISIPYFTVDSYGHITLAGTRTHTVTVNQAVQQQDHYSSGITAGTLGSSTDSLGLTIDIPWANVNTHGHITAYGTRTHTVLGVLTSSDLIQDGVKGSTANHYAVCTTTGSTLAKVATLEAGSINSLVKGLRVIVKFTNRNTKVNPTLNLNGKGAKLIHYNGANLSTTYASILYGCVEFVYDGTYWLIVDPVPVITPHSIWAYMEEYILDNISLNCGNNTEIDNQTTTNGNTYIKISNFDTEELHGYVGISGTGNITVSSDSNGNITIGSTGTNAYDLHFYNGSNSIVTYSPLTAEKYFQTDGVTLAGTSSSINGTSAFKISTNIYTAATTADVFGTISLLDNTYGLLHISATLDSDGLPNINRYTVFSTRNGNYSALIAMGHFGGYNSSLVWYRYRYDSTWYSWRRLLTYGPRMLSGLYDNNELSPLTLSIINTPNVLFGLSGSYVYIQYKQASATSWSTLSTSDSNDGNVIDNNYRKNMLMTKENAGLRVGNRSLNASNVSAGDGLRFIIDAGPTSSSVSSIIYAQLNSIYLYFSSRSHSCTVSIKAQTYLNYSSTFAGTWNTLVSNVSISGGPGGNMYYFDYIDFGGNNGQDSHYRLLMIEILVNTPSPSAPPSLIHVGAFGGNVWFKPGEQSNYLRQLDGGYYQKPVIPNPTDYYWANVNISLSANYATTPGFKRLIVSDYAAADYSNNTFADNFDVYIKGSAFIGNTWYKEKCHDTQLSFNTGYYFARGELPHVCICKSNSGMYVGLSESIPIGTTLIFIHTSESSPFNLTSGIHFYYCTSAIDSQGPTTPGSSYVQSGSNLVIKENDNWSIKSNSGASVSSAIVMAICTSAPSKRWILIPLG